jgi:type I restriction enzyme R subunit
MRIQVGLGVFWHNKVLEEKQISMFFFWLNKILRKIPGNWTFVIVTDRNELDDQNIKSLFGPGVIKEDKKRAETSEGVKTITSGRHIVIYLQLSRSSGLKRHYTQWFQRGQILLL